MSSLIIIKQDLISRLKIRTEDHNSSMAEMESQYNKSIVKLDERIREGLVKPTTAEKKKFLVFRLGYREQHFFEMSQIYLLQRLEKELAQAQNLYNQKLQSKVINHQNEWNRLVQDISQVNAQFNVLEEKIDTTSQKGYSKERIQATYNAQKQFLEKQEKLELKNLLDQKDGDMKFSKDYYNSTTCTLDEIVKKRDQFYEARVEKIKNDYQLTLSRRKEGIDIREKALLSDKNLSIKLIDDSTYKLNAEEERIDTRTRETNSSRVKIDESRAEKKGLLTRNQAKKNSYEKRLEDLKTKNNIKIQGTQAEIQKIFQKITETGKKIDEELKNIGNPSVTFAVQHLNSIFAFNYTISSNTKAISNASSFVEEVLRSFNRFVQEVRNTTNIRSAAISRRNNKEELLDRIQKDWPKLTSIHEYIKEGLLNVDTIYADLKDPEILKQD